MIDFFVHIPQNIAKTESMSLILTSFISRVFLGKT